MWQVPLTVPKDMTLKKGSIIIVRSHVSPPAEPFHLTCSYNGENLEIEMIPGPCGC